MSLKYERFDGDWASRAQAWVWSSQSLACNSALDRLAAGNAACRGVKVTRLVVAEHWPVAVLFANFCDILYFIRFKKT